LDDWTPTRTCEALVREARGAGADVGITVYRNALHSFDSVGLPVRFLSDVDNAATCIPRLASMRGPVLNLPEIQGCLRKGATVGWNPEATEAARKNVWAQLAESLK
ncbi:MAG: hypothetical protein HYV92_05050, partial [Candidatus Rokubacteria bacterium]|nr:hypothetical protein [Candidatus Rokubacteria bacterium]